MPREQRKQHQDSGQAPTRVSAVGRRPMPGAAGFDHHFVTVHEDTPREATLHVAEAGAGTPVLLLHGHFQHWYVWRHVTALLAAGHRCLCVDLRGFGWSEQTASGYDLDTLADDVDALADALALGKIVLIGHDLGAQVAFRLASHTPQRCAGLLAVNTHHPFPARRRMVASLWRMWFTALLEYPILGTWVIRHWPSLISFLLRHSARDRTAWTREDLAEFTEATRASARPTQQVLWRYVLTEMPRLLRGYGKARLDVPAILLTGTRDTVIPPSLLSGDDSRTARLAAVLAPGYGHQLPIEAPEQIDLGLRILRMISD